MEELNLPPNDIIIYNESDHVYLWDIIRKKKVVCFPEEWVRQNMIHYLVNYLNYPKSLIKIEGQLKYNTLDKRADIIVYDRNAQPFCLVECKAPKVKINKQTLLQSSNYLNTLKAPYLILTNGNQHFCCHIDYQFNKFSMLKDFPLYPQNLKK